MADDISLIIGVDYKEMTGFIKTSGQTKRVLKEIAKEFARTGDQSAYMKSINQVVQADKKLAASSQLGRSEIMKLGAAMRQEIKFTEALTKATQKQTAAQITSNKVMSQAKNRMNGNNMAIQQLGYQFGDFAVQVQSGTSAFVAFSQQGAQLAGILPMIAKPLGLSMGAAIGLSAGLGILIPIIGIAGRAIFEFGDEADKSTDKADRLKSQMDSVTSSLRDFALAKEAANAGVSLDELFLTKQTGGVTEVKSQISDIKKEIEELVSIAEIGFKDIGVIPLSELQEEFEYILGGARLGGKNVALTRMQEAALGSRRQREAAIGPNLPEEKSLSVLNQIEANETQRLELARKRNALEGKLLPLKQLQAKFAEEDLLRTSETNRETEEKVRLLQTEIKHGADSVAIEKLKKEFAVQEFAREVSLLNISDKRKMVLIEQFKIRQAGEVELNKLAAQNEETYTRLLAQNEVFVNSLNEASDEARVKAEKQINLVAQLEEKYGEALVTALALAGVDISASMSDFIDKAVKAQSDLEGLDETYGTQLDIINAQIEALEEGKNVEVAAFIAGEKAKITALYESSKALATTANDTEALAAASFAFLEAMGQLDALAAAKTKLAGLKDTGRGSSKQSPAEQLREYLDTLGQQAELEGKLVGLFGEKRNTEEEVIKARQKYGEVFGATQEAELRGTLAQIEADKKRQKVLEEARSQQQALADTIQSSMEDAFMSIVDGTKSAEDAFKDMARIIIKELYKVLVVQQIVGSFEAGGGGILGSIFGATQAEGGAWQGGSQIKAYANGGIVGGPTVFPMARGKIGLMGEAGPEAIMPLKRGANGKLGVQAEGGGGDNVVIHQNFNFQANGDDSVKRIIAQAAPQIANMTKKSMLDDRRRGGQMKATFG